MPSTIPNNLSLALLTAYLPSGQNIDAHLLTALPGETDTTGSLLAIASGGSYTTKNFALTTPVADGSGAIAVPAVSTLTWTGFYTTSATPIVAIGFTRRAGGSYSGTDPVISAMELAQDTAIASVTTTNGSPDISTSNSFSALAIGQPVSGTGIPTGTFILSISGSTSMRLSKRATASGTITATFRTPNPYTPATTIGSAIDLTLSLPASLVKVDDYS